MKPIHTLLRIAEHSALSTVTLSGTVLDIGGDTHAEYRSKMDGTFTVETVNLDPKTSPDVLHDLEQPLPIQDESYDNAILINVLEHIYHAQQLLREAVRVTRPNGKIVVVVPFLFPIHPDPSDYWRFSKATLSAMANELGLQSVSVVPLGTGVFAARYVMLDRLLPSIIRRVLSYTIAPLVPMFDRAFAALARALKKKYDPADYALGYCMTGVRT